MRTTALILLATSTASVALVIACAGGPGGSLVVDGGGGATSGGGDAVATSGFVGTSGGTSGISVGTSGGTSGGIPEVDAGGCHNGNDCKNGTFCLPGDAPRCGGAAPLRECENDEGCLDDALVCRMEECGGSTCIAKCTRPADCETTPPNLQTCSLATGKCAPAKCSATSCPANFTCVAADTGCGRKSCTRDADCSGACVNGFCWAEPGECVLPAP